MARGGYVVTIWTQGDGPNGIVDAFDLYEEAIAYVRKAQEDPKNHVGRPDGWGIYDVAARLEVFTSTLYADGYREQTR